MGSIPGSKRSPGGGSSNPLQYSCLKNPMDRRACGSVGYSPQDRKGVGHDLLTKTTKNYNKILSKAYLFHSSDYFFVYACVSKCILLFPFFKIKFLKGSISANTASEIKEAKLSLYFNLLPLLCLSYDSLQASQVMLVVKNLPANAGEMRHRFNPWVRKIPWRRKRQTNLIFLPGESQEQKSLAGYSIHKVAKSWAQISMHS